jgi:hypothetical protein
MTGMRFKNSHESSWLEYGSQKKRYGIKIAFMKRHNVNYLKW